MVPNLLDVLLSTRELGGNSQVKLSVSPRERTVLGLRVHSDGIELTLGREKVGDGFVDGMGRMGSFDGFEDLVRRARSG